MEYLEKMKGEKKVIPNYMLFFIPSWSELLGYPTLGNYANQKVARIISSPVIFFSGAEYSIETELGSNYYLFGLGYYYLKFEIETGTSQMQYDKYIVDNRQLTCLCLSDFVYDYMATARNITLEDDQDVVINDHIFKVPIDLSNKSENQITFIKGVLMRNLFIPYKDIMLEMMNLIRKEDSYQISKTGHMLLSTDRNSYNKILVSDNLKMLYGQGYFNPTAGINQIATGVDQYLSQILSTENMRYIDNIIGNLKNIYSKLRYDPMYVYSILETAYTSLKSEIPAKKESEIKADGIKTKESILLTADERLDSIASWPTEFPRKKKEEVEIKLAPEKPTPGPRGQIYEPTPSEISSYIPTATLIDKQKEGEEFELRMRKSESVQDKPLPIPLLEEPEEILLYVKKVIEENYNMKSFSIACGLARDNMKKMMLHSKVVWELSRFERIYQNKPANMSLPPKDKEDILHKINNWISNLEQERLERERLEQERLEKERLEKERLEKLRLEEERRKQEQIEREKLEKERQKLEEERIEAVKLAKIREQQEIARIEREKLKHEEEEKEKLRQAKIREEQELARIEREKLKREEEEKEKLRQEQLREEQEREEKIRQSREELERERNEAERIEKEKRELQRLKDERKLKQKQEKAKKKREKKLKSLQKKKEKEKEKISKL